MKRSDSQVKLVTARYQLWEPGIKPVVTARYYSSRDSQVPKLINRNQEWQPGTSTDCQVTVTMQKWQPSICGSQVPVPGSRHQPELYVLELPATWQVRIDPGLLVCVLRPLVETSPLVGFLLYLWFPPYQLYSVCWGELAWQLRLSDETFWSAFWTSSFVSALSA